VTSPASDLFATAAPYYARFRPRYPDELFEFLAARLGLDGGQLALDVGCGTGQASIPLARHVSRVIALDPVPEMLELGREAAERAGVANIEWELGDSTLLGGLRTNLPGLVLFAASFHWTDRTVVTEVLDGVVPPGGALVVIGDGLGEAAQPDWVHLIARIRSRYLGPDRRAANGVYLAPAHSHLEVLQTSPFSAVEEVTWRWSRELTVDEVVGLQFSYSFSTPALFGADARAFADEVRAGVLAAYPSGIVTEPLVVQVLIARRPA